MRLMRCKNAWPIAVIAVAAAGLGGWACGGAKSGKTRRFSRSDVESYLDRLEQPGLVMGEFPLAKDAVLDGDTIRVAGLKSTLRLLAIDTEETFKREHERREFEKGWDGYLDRLRKKSHGRPPKAPTPLGEEAKKFAKKFFKGVKKVRLERDHPKEIRGVYSRYLVYIFAEKDGEWVNYNLESVKAGMSPYFTKYSFSRRFHSQFVEAQEQARRQQIGIWEPGAMHFDDYPLRLEWWQARGDFIEAFEIEAEGKPNFITLTHWDALRRMRKLVGQEVEILGMVGDVRRGERGPTRVTLSRRRNADFPLIFFDEQVLKQSGIERFKREFVRVRGKLTEYRYKRSGKTELQMVINAPEQIVGSQVPDLIRGPGAPEPAEKKPPIKPAPVEEPDGAEQDEEVSGHVVH